VTHPVGAVPLGGDATRFCVWAPESPGVRVRLLDSGREGDTAFDLAPLAGGYHGGIVAGCPAGTRYRYILHDGRELADPASRAQPDGVHGPSQVVDLEAHEWRDGDYRLRPLWDHVISEVHIGTFSAEGTFDGAIDELDGLAEVGISAVEVMPVAQFAGRRNWGYDGVFPFAVQDSYGGAAGLQRFVDACHQRRLAVILDVVYNHLGPEGNVLGAYGPYFTERYRTPWGPAVNVDGPGSDEVRAYFEQNAHQWFADFHVDALRLDAVHEIVDRTALPFLAELARQAARWGEVRGRPFHLIAESADNDPRLVTPADAGGLGLDAQWNDDFHHALHALLTGERSGYYVDYGAVDDLARAMDTGFVFQGQHSAFRGRRHGAPSGSLAPERLVLFAQNHDHIGNRPRGDRLVTMLSPEQARLAAAVVLLAPGIPLLFMGEEYGETAPFPYFVDHGDPALVEAVRSGRASEFTDLGAEGGLFDPADPATFEAARIDRSLRHKPAHAALLDVHRDLIELRRSTPALRRSSRTEARAWADGDILTLVRSHPEGSVAVLYNFSERATTARLPDPGEWADLLEPAAPAAAAAGEARPLGAWGFGVWHTTGEVR
jgi:maltooligosyltrehalose trehalohydrolase